MPPSNNKKIKSNFKAKYRKTGSENRHTPAENVIPSSEDNLNSRMVSMTEQHTLFAVGLGITSFAVYVGTAFPSVPGGDSGELIVAAYELGVAHPPGYPLFTLLSWLVMKVLPIGSLAWRVNVLNAAFSAMAISLMALLVMRLTGRLSSALLAIGTWGFCKLTWTWSITAEVFGLNNLFTCLLLLVTHHYHVEENKEKKMNLSILGSFLCGLSLCNQHTLVIYVACIAVFVLVNQHQLQGLTVSYLLYLSSAFLAGLSFYLYLPISAHIGPARWTWGDQRSISGFIKHLLRQEYGTFDLGKDHVGQGLYHGLSTYCNHILGDMTITMVLLFCVGCCLIITRIKKDQYNILIWTMMAVYMVFFSWRANLDIKNPLLLGVVERFWMQADIIVVIIAAQAFSWLMSYAEALTDLVKKIPMDLILAVIVFTAQIHRNFGSCNQYSNTVVYEFGMEIMRGLPKGAIVLTKGDLPSNILRYLYLCENVRPDISLFDQEVLTYDWSVPMMRKAWPNITFPGDLLHLKTQIQEDGRQSFDFKTFLDVNYHKAPIFGCIGVQDHENSWKQSYELWPYGVCSRFVRKGDNPDVDEYAKLTSKAAAEWKHKGFDDTSWENVAANEMWHAKISSAFFLYEMAEKSTKEEKAKYLLHSYNLYSLAMERDTSFPPHWYKNYALVCERLLHVQHDFDNVVLLKKSIASFKKFVELEPSDKDHVAIVSVIKDLSKHLKMIQYHKP